MRAYLPRTRMGVEGDKSMSRTSRLKQVLLSTLAVYVCMAAPNMMAEARSSSSRIDHGSGTAPGNNPYNGNCTGSLVTTTTTDHYYDFPGTTPNISSTDSLNDTCNCVVAFNDDDDDDDDDDEDDDDNFEIPTAWIDVDGDGESDYNNLYDAVEAGYDPGEVEAVFDPCNDPDPKTGACN